MERKLPWKMKTVEGNKLLRANLPCQAGRSKDKVATTLTSKVIPPNDKG